MVDLFPVLRKLSSSWDTYLLQHQACHPPVYGLLFVIILPSYACNVQHGRCSLFGLGRFAHILVILETDKGYACRLCTLGTRAIPDLSLLSFSILARTLFNRDMYD